MGKDEEMWARASTAEVKIGLSSSTWSPEPSPSITQVSSIRYHELLSKSADARSPALIPTNSLLSLAQVCRVAQVQGTMDIESI